LFSGSPVAKAAFESRHTSMRASRSGRPTGRPLGSFDGKPDSRFGSSTSDDGLSLRWCDNCREATYLLIGWQCGDLATSAT
jgi:hypothetical protein